MSENTVAREIVDATYRVHTILGPGLLESVYEPALAYELEKRGLHVTRQQPVPALYEKIEIHTAFYADLMVEDQVIVEIKSGGDHCASAQKATPHLPEAGRQTSRSANQLQCLSDQRRNHPNRQRTPRMIAIQFLSWRSWCLSLRLCAKSYSSASPKSAARFSNLVNSCKNTSSTFPTGPLRCLASSSSACPRKLSSCGR